MRLNELITPKIVNTNIKKPHDIARSKELARDSANAYAKGSPIVGRGKPDEPSISGAEYSKTNFYPSKLDDDAYNAYVKEVTPLMGSNPYVPEIYKIVHVKDPSGAVIPRYEMRAYEPGTNFSSKEILALLRKSFPDKAKDVDEAFEGGYKFTNQDIWHKLVAAIQAAATQDILTDDDQLNEVLEIIRNVVGSNKTFDYDMHAGNFMVRRTSHGPQLVITDPVQDGGHSTTQSSGVQPWARSRGHAELYTAVDAVEGGLWQIAFNGKPNQQKCDDLIRRIGVREKFSPNMIIDAFMKKYKKTPLEYAWAEYKKPI